MWRQKRLSRLPKRLFRGLKCIVLPSEMICFELQKSLIRKQAYCFPTFEWGLFVFSARRIGTLKFRIFRTFFVLFRLTNARKQDFCSHGSFRFLRLLSAIYLKTAVAKATSTARFHRFSLPVLRKNARQDGTYVSEPEPVQSSSFTENTRLLLQNKI